ncbi:axin isoform X2 [Topomyia yanbarensis]|uniref:axin isoform X2 n=1 Tax=Topomyia yanbarensis TaxID=2498891 RepID=UPI00273C9721|nr:axin isoform X2 [Topomyia yanbarensis]
MSQYSVHKFDDTTCSGPRPPVPGKESRRKMTDTLNSEKSRDSPPNYYRWSEKLSYLLEDVDGAELFKRFVELQGDEHSNQLNFYFACEGLKQQRDNDKMTQLIGAIYKRFLKRAPRGSKLHVSESMRNMIKAGLKNEILLAPDIFDQMQADVAAVIGNTTYPNFLQSDLYIQYIQNMQTSSGSGSGATSCTGIPLGISGASTGALSSMTNSSSMSELVLHSSSALPTLHEDSELVNADSIEQLYGALGPGIAGSSISVISSVSGAGSGKPAMTLTKDALMATQKRRLEMRPPGDGQSHTQRRHQSRQHSAMEQRQINENVVFNDNLKHIPRNQRVHPKVLSTEQFQTELMQKLKAVQQAQEKEGEVIRKVREIDQVDKSQSNRSFADAIRQKLQVEDDNDQDILDKHVSRVWSDLTPSRSPDIMSPCPNISRTRRSEMGNFGSGSMSAQSSMRHSKSMPDGHPLSMAGPAAQPLPRNKPLNNKWPSVYTDSGISLLSTDTLSKYSSKDMPSMSTNSSRPLSRTMHADMSAGNIAHLLQESSRRLDDETRRSKRHQHPLPPPPLPPAAAPSSLVPPPIPAKPQSSMTEFTVVVYLFCDEEVPYRIKIPGTHPPTLKQFKDYLPKKGNYRFFFKTRCDDLDSPVIQEEINNDNEVLPLFEGKVMGTVKPLD